MAKRVSPEEKPFNPVQERFVRETLNPMLEPEHSAEQATGVSPSPAPSTAHVVQFPDHQVVAPVPLPVEKSEPRAEERRPKERLGREKRVLLTRDEEAELEQLVIDMGRRLNTSLTLSNVLRATTLLLTNSRDELLKQSEKTTGLKRPSNKDAAALATFEHNLARLLDRAFRGTRLLE